MKNIRVLFFLIAAAAFFTGADGEALANHYGYHHGYRAYYGGVPASYGYWYWPTVSYYNPYYYTPAYYNNYGYSYYTFYRQPRYRSFGAITFSKDKKPSASLGEILRATKPLVNRRGTAETRAACQWCGCRAAAPRWQKTKRAIS